MGTCDGGSGKRGVCRQIYGHAGHGLSARAPLRQLVLHVLRKLSGRVRASSSAFISCKILQRCSFTLPLLIYVR